MNLCTKKSQLLIVQKKKDTHSTHTLTPLWNRPTMKEKFNYPTKVNKFAASQPAAVTAAAFSPDAPVGGWGVINGTSQSFRRTRSESCRRSETAQTRSRREDGTSRKRPEDRNECDGGLLHVMCK